MSLKLNLQVHFSKVRFVFLKGSGQGVSNKIHIEYKILWKVDK